MARGTVKRAAAIVMGGMIVSRLLGYVRFKAIFYYFGGGAETGAFFGAFVVPDLLYILASGGAMTAAFIPVYSELLEKKQEEGARRLASSSIRRSNSWLKMLQHLSGSQQIHNMKWRLRL